MHIEKSPVCQGMMAGLYGRGVHQATKVRNILRLGCRQSVQAGAANNHIKCLEALDLCHCKYNSADPPSDPTLFHIYYVSMWRFFQQFFWEVQITVSLQGLQKISTKISSRNVGGNFLDRILWLFSQILLLSSQITFPQCLSYKYNSKLLCSEKLSMWSAKICPHNA